MSDWTWEYVPDAVNVVGALTQAQTEQVESLASRIADAVAVRRIGTPFDVTEAVSNVKSYGEGPVMIWFLEDYRDDVVLVVRVQHFGLPDPTGLRHRPGLCDPNHDAKVQRGGPSNGCMPGTPRAAPAISDGDAPPSEGGPPRWPRA